MTIDGYSPAWWLPSPHLQTVWGRMVRPRQAVAFRREALATPDGDELIVDHAGADDAPARVILLHGLEGSSNSVYVQGMAQLALARGIAVTAINFRYCARDPRNLDRCMPNKRPRLYHSGETNDFDFVVNELAHRTPAGRRYAIGVSLGGNVVLKWLGEHPGQQLVHAAAALSVPYDLGEGGAYMETGLGPFYIRAFVRTLVQKATHIVREFPELASKLDLVRIARSSTFREFDDAATAPLHGMSGADEYYATCSSIRFLERITTPTLCVNALDDPFLPPEIVDRVRLRLPSCAQLVVTDHGGHIGFVSGSPRKPTYWAEELAVGWVAAR
ncbi:MAG: alpha/beta fold hydrolase [Acidobacteria bacterium]|nr:alpha/beta fold hydrolase [Acidobacteriota bacterium]